MAFNIQGLLSGLAGLPNAIGSGLLGPMNANPGLGLDSQSLSQSRQQALSDLAMGLMAGDRRNPGGTLMAATQNARQGYQTRVFDLLKENETARMMEERTKRQKAQDSLFANLSPEDAMLAAANPDAFVEQGIQSRFQQGADGRTDDIKEWELAVSQGYTGSLQEWIMGQKRAGATNVSVNTNLPPEENELSKALGKAAGEEFAGMSTQARGAMGMLEQTQLLEPLVNSPNFISGTLGDARLTVAKALGLPGVEETQTYFAAVGRQVGENIKLFGAGTGLSDADREFAKQMAAGSIELTPASIKKIIGINKVVSAQVIKNYNKRRKELAEPQNGPSRPQVYSLYPELSVPGSTGVDALLDKYAPKP